MDSASKNQPQPAPEPQGYGDAYSAEAVLEGGAHRSFDDYLALFRERLWTIIIVAILSFAGVATYTLLQVKQYQSRASIQIFRRDPVVMQTQRVVDNDVRSTEDINTQVQVLESDKIVVLVAERLQGEDRQRFLAPYKAKNVAITEADIPAIIRDHRIVDPQRLSYVIAVLYTHPDPKIAALVANLFADEFISYNAKLRIDESMRAVEELRLRADEQRRKVDELAKKLHVYREQNNLISLDQRKDIVTEGLKALSALTTQTSARLREAEVKWHQVEERTKAGSSLLDLPFISGQSSNAQSASLVTQLQQQLSSQKIQLAQLSERYREKHPRMVAARNSIAQTERELQSAVDAAASAVKSEYETAFRNDKEAHAQLSTREAESLEIDRYAVDYSNLEREFRINEQLLQNILGSMRATSMTSNIETQSARIVDQAIPSLRPISPRVMVNLAAGLLGGIALGLLCAFIIACIDDRVKSTYDIESGVGLPLLGIIPEVKRMDPSHRAQVAISNLDRQTAEAFLSLHSSMRLKDGCKDARVLLTTSTIPGEGKSFLTTNLALTFAAHGERVIVVDCDLRKPNIHRSFKLENKRGLIDVLQGDAKFDEVVLCKVHPNLDVLVTGGRSRNPTQLLNSSEFETLIADLRKRYDRVFIDTPPLAAVTDAMVVLPLCDGSLFTIYFNKVRRKAARFAAEKLREANVPNFGAVLNGLDLAVSGYYYAQYYDKTYKDYYVEMAKQDPDSLDR
jgi:capsular exopolysaccharide synthesis family protein